MKKLVFSLVTLLFLSGCGNQPAVPAAPLPAPSKNTNSTTAPSDTPYIPMETIVETAPEVPAKEPPVAPESELAETEAVPVPQAKTSITTPQETQYETEIVPPDTDAAHSPVIYQSLVPLIHLLAPDPFNYPYLLLNIFG